MLKAFLGYEMFDEAKELFRKIIQSGDKRRKVKSKIKPDRSTFTMMLEAFVRDEKWDDFEHAYEQMLQYGYPFNTKHHLWMVLKASCAGKVFLFRCLSLLKVLLLHSVAFGRVYNIS